MTKKILRRMTLEQFYSQYLSLSRAVSPETVQVVENILRPMQERMFQMLWDQVQSDTIRTYQTIGQLTQLLIGNHPSPSALKKKLKECPIRGYIRTRNEMHDDVAFVVLLVRDEVYLLLNNAARNSGMTQVNSYDKEAEMFIGQGMGLIDFFMINDIVLLDGQEQSESA